jgi:hypothetical protein
MMIIVYVIGLRAWLLMFRMEFEADMLAAEKVATARQPRAAGLRSQGHLQRPLGDGRSLTASSYQSKSMRQRANMAILSSWFVRNARRFGSRRFVRTASIFILVWTLIGSIVTSVLYFSIAAEHRQDGGPVSCTESNRLTVFALFWVFVVEVSVFFVLIGVVWRLSRHKDDGFGVKSELRVICMSIGICMLVLIICLIFKSLDGSTVTFWAAILISPAVFVASTGWPLWLSYKHQWTEARFAAESRGANNGSHSWVRGGGETKSAPAVRPQIEQVLANDIGFDLYLEFCRRHFMSESPSFYKRVQTFKANLVRNLSFTDNRDSQAEAVTIWSLFVRPGAEWEINIPAEMRDAISTKLSMTTGASIGTTTSSNDKYDPQRPTISSGESATPLTTTTTTTTSSLPTPLQSSFDAVPRTLVAAASSNRAELPLEMTQLHTLFDEATEEIVKLMRTNLLCEFFATPSFQQLLAAGGHGGLLGSLAVLKAISSETTGISNAGAGGRHADQKQTQARQFVQSGVLSRHVHSSVDQRYEHQHHPFGFQPSSGESAGGASDISISIDTSTRNSLPRVTVAA